MVTEDITSAQTHSVCVCVCVCVLGVFVFCPDVQTEGLLRVWDSDIRSVHIYVCVCVCVCVCVIV